MDKSGRIWVAGGLTGPDSATTKTEFYDPTVGVWTPGPDLPVALHHVMMVSYQNTVWVIGGLELQGSEVSGIASARVLRLNEAEGLWVQAPALHHARGAGAAAVVGNKIVVVGGRTGATGGTPAQDVPTTEVFDGTSWHDAAPLPVPGDHLAAASDRKYVYVVGGRKLEPAASTAALQRFDPNTGQWTQLPPAPSPVTDCGVAIIGGKLIVVGGESAVTVFSTVRAYNLTSQDLVHHPAQPGRPPARAGRHRDRQDPVRHRRRIPARTRRTHQHPANPHLPQLARGRGRPSETHRQNRRKPVATLIACHPMMRKPPPGRPGGGIRRIRT